MKKISFIFCLFCLILIFNCQKELKLENTNGLTPTLPIVENIYPKQLLNQGSGRLGFLFFNELSPKDNTITDQGATLGRVLFYDKKMSYNNTTSCGSCHNQKNGFADNQLLSSGFEGQKTKRNSSTIVNAAFQSSYFWDGRETSLEDMVLRPIKNHIEMGIDKIDNLEKKLAGTNYYSNLFSKAFNSPEITKDKISKALAQFIRSMVSFEAKVDIENRLSNEEELGYEIFRDKGNCSNCHGGVNLRGYEEDFFIQGGGSSFQNFHNIGLDINYADPGRGEYDNNFIGYFKTPSLRNVELTAPYMHDGRFNTLEEVVEHYNSGVKNHPKLSLELRLNWDETSAVRRLNLTEKEKKALVSFLKTLTDPSLVSDVKYSDPFVN